MEFKQLEAFVNVVKYKSFSKAADATFLTQPTVSAHIAQLEKELGVILIDRNMKESRPTKEGRTFYNYAINILNTRERAIASLNSLSSELNGVLELRASTIPGEYIVPELVNKFSLLHPMVRFNICESDSLNVGNEILDNLGEIGFTGSFSDNGLKYEELVKDKMVIITPDNDKFRKTMERGKSLRVSELKEEAFIFREDGSSTRKAFEDELASSDTVVSLKNIITVNSINSVKEYVRRGMGVSILSKLSVKENEGYLAFDLEDLNPNRAFYMVYNKNITLTPLALEFKNFVLNEYSK